MLVLLALFCSSIAAILEKLVQLMQHRVCVPALWLASYVSSNRKPSFVFLICIWWSFARDTSELRSDPHSAEEEGGSSPHRRCGGTCRSTVDSWIRRGLWLATERTCAPSKGCGSCNNTRSRKNRRTLLSWQARYRLWICGSLYRILQWLCLSYFSCFSNSVPSQQTIPYKMTLIVPEINAGAWSIWNLDCLRYWQMLEVRTLIPKPVLNPWISLNIWTCSFFRLKLLHSALHCFALAF